MMNDTPDGTTDTGRGTSDTTESAVARARAEVYGLLSRVFDGDSETLSNALEDGTFTELAATLPAEMPADALARSDLDTESLEVGYDNLFVVPGPHYVPPFASAHADDPSESFESDSPYHEVGQSGELLGEPAAAAARTHSAVGFESQRGDGIPDHLAVDFEFMQLLCEHEARLLQSDESDDEVATVRELQRTTISRLAWLDTFHEAVAQHDTVEGIYAALARFARTFVAWDAEEGIGSTNR